MAETLDLCRRFHVTSRIAARISRARLAAELGDRALEIQRERIAAVAGEARLTALARRVAAVAAELGIELAFAKFMALQLGGFLLAGSRPAGDLDVLVPAARSEELAAALCRCGFQRTDLPAKEHQLPPLIGPDGAFLEVHTRLPGLGGFELLHERGGLGPLAGWPGKVWLPRPELLRAHALVHGIAQHGFGPDSYPLFRMVGDLLDLGFDRAPQAVEEVRRWVPRDLAAAEIAATRELCRGLAAGRADALPPEASLLLHHILAGRLDPRYARALKLSFWKPRPSERSSPARSLHAVWRSLILTRTQVDLIYGPPATAWGYLGRRLARPFDLLWRLGRAGWSAFRVGR